MNKCSFIVSIAAMFLLTACSHSVPSARSTAATPAQTEQLANVLAASRFLHDRCQRTDIPGAEGRLNAALAQAKQRGWSLDDTRQKALSARADKIFAALDRDGTPLAEKCAVFNHQLVPFIDGMRHPATAQ